MMGYNDVASLLAALEEQRKLVATQFDEIFSDKASDTATDENVDAELSAVLSDSDNAEAIETYLTTLSFDHATDAAQRLLSTGTRHACNRCRKPAATSWWHSSMHHCLSSPKSPKPVRWR